MTVGIIVVAIGNFLISWVAGGGSWNPFLAFFAEGAFAHPWTFLTHPFAAEAADVLGIIFMSYWLWFMGGTVEKELGSGPFAIFFGVITVVPALMMLAVQVITGHSMMLYGLYLPVAGVTVAWATRHPNQSILFMMIIPILAKWLGWLTVILVVFRYGYPNPPVGLFAGVHLLLAYMYAANRFPFAWGGGGIRTKKQQWLPREKDDRYLRDVRDREMERAERERLRKLFEGSLKDDPEDQR